MLGALVLAHHPSIALGLVGIRSRKVGGIRFLAIRRVRVSFCMVRR